MSIKMSLFFILIGTMSIAQEKTVIPAFELGILRQFPNVRDFTMSHDGSEAYFSAQSPLGELSVIIRIEHNQGTWDHPEIVPFSGRYMDLEPFLSSDGLKLYFASDRPMNNDSKTPKDYDLWYVQRSNINDKWSKPINMGSAVNTEYNEFFPSIALNKNLYFTSDPPDSKGKDDIYFCEWKNGHYSKPISLSDSVNSDGYEFNAYVSPDESFLIYSCYNRSDGLGSGDLYISYQKADLSWTKAINLGPEINSEQMDYCPFVNLETKTLYFTSRRSNVEMPSDGFNSFQEFLNEVDGYENGLSRIYTCSFGNFLPKLK